MMTIETTDGRSYLPTNEPRTRVWVATCGENRLGTLVYVTNDGWMGVRLDGEGSRVDEWQPSQVKVVA